MINMSCEKFVQDKNQIKAWFEESLFVVNIWPGRSHLNIKY